MCQKHKFFMVLLFNERLWWSVWPGIFDKGRVASEELSSGKNFKCCYGVTEINGKKKQSKICEHMNGNPKDSSAKLGRQQNTSDTARLL